MHEVVLKSRLGDDTAPQSPVSEMRISGEQLIKFSGKRTQEYEVHGQRSLTTAVEDCVPEFHIFSGEKQSFPISVYVSRS